MCTNGGPRQDNQNQRQNHHHQQFDQSQWPRKDVNLIQKCGCCENSYDEVNMINQRLVYDQQLHHKQYQMGMSSGDGGQGACDGRRTLTNQPGQH